MISKNKILRKYYLRKKEEAEGKRIAHIKGWFSLATES